MGDIVIAQRFLAHYRIEFVQDLEDRLASQGHRLHFLFNRTLGEMRLPACCRRIPAVSMVIPVGQRRDTLMFSPGLTREVAEVAPRLLILGDVGEIPNNFLLARFALNWNVPYLVWGLGRIPHNRSSRWRSILSPAIDWYYSHAAGFICYGTYARSVYRPYGKPCYLATNATRRKPNPQERREVLAAIDSRPAPPPLQVAYMGQLSPEKRVDVLLTALSRMAPERWQLHVLGGGLGLPGLKRLARDLGIEARVVFHGDVFDARRKFEILTSCHVGVLPGRGGLAIQELMWHGVSVISGIADGTERDLIDPSNGVVLDDWLTVSDIVDALEAYMCLGDEERRLRAVACLNTVEANANTARMVDGFATAVDSTRASDSSVLSSHRKSPPRSCEDPS